MAHAQDEPPKRYAHHVGEDGRNSDVCPLEYRGRKVIDSKSRNRNVSLAAASTLRPVSS
jgi:hypothetical protein